MQDKFNRKLIFLIGTFSLICFIYLQINLQATDLSSLAEANVADMASVSPEIDLLKFCIEKLRYMISLHFA